MNYDKDNVTSIHDTKLKANKKEKIFCTIARNLTILNNKIIKGTKEASKYNSYIIMKNRHPSQKLVKECI